VLARSAAPSVEVLLAWANAAIGAESAMIESKTRIRGTACHPAG
jgi:hypothetical protein